MKRKALGKGLEALLPEKTEDLQQSIIEIPIDKIIPSKYQPRFQFDKKKLDSLAESINENGVLQPILVRKLNDNYQIIAGERRWKAAKIAGLKTIPAIIRDVVDSQILQLALIENLQREDLNPIEEAMAYKTMIDEFNITHEELSKRLGKDRSSITNSLRLLKLPEEVKNLLIDGSISMGHGRALLSIPDEKEQIKLAKKIVNQGLPVRFIEELIHRKKGKRKEKQVDAHILEIENKLQRVLSTKVKIHAKKSKGKIVIYFYSEEDFNRIYDILIK